MSDSTGDNAKRPAPFRDAVFSSPKNEECSQSLPSNMRLGENGCPEFSDIGSELLALSQMVRGSNPIALCDKLLTSANVDDVSSVIILAFVTRNIRGGKGERDLSYRMFLWIWHRFPETAKKLLPLFANHYGCWKDYLLLAEKAQTKKHRDVAEPILEESIQIMRDQFQTDLDELVRYETRKKQDNGGGDDDWDMVFQNKTKVVGDGDGDGDGAIFSTHSADAGPKLSLLAKWLPRENTHFDKKLNFVERFLAEDPEPVERTPNSHSGEESLWKSRPKKRYRTQVARLASFLSLPEVFLSANRADEINFRALASRATLKLSRALLNETADGSARRPNDPKRRKCAELFVGHMVREGLKGGALMPDEIVAEILKGNVSPLREKVLDAQWKDLWKTVVDQAEATARDDGIEIEMDLSKMVPLSDVSGSMYGKPLEVSIAMGIGISEITHPAFRDMVLTFESQPKWHKLTPGDSIVKKVQSLERAGWGKSTNFEGAYEQILVVCREHRLARDDVPALIVFSDMQFDEAQGDGNLVAMHETIRSKFVAMASELGWDDGDGDADPTPIVYWNVRDTGGGENGHPVEADTEGAVLLSGFSPSLLKMVMNGEALRDDEVEVVQADGTVRTEKVRVTPSEVLAKILNDPLYDPVREILVASDEGVLSEYKSIEIERPQTPTGPMTRLYISDHLDYVVV